MLKPVSEKVVIKVDSRAIFINAPAEAIEAIDLPILYIASKLTGYFDYIHLFAKSESVFRKGFPKLKAHFKPKGMLYISWAKTGNWEPTFL